MACDMLIQPTALQELDGIVAYLSSFGPATAKSFLEEWGKALEELCEGTVKHGPPRMSALANLGYRTVLIKGYVILFFQDGDTVIVAHLFRLGQDCTDTVLRGI